MTEKLTKTEKLLLEYFRKFPLNKPITTEQNELAKSLSCSRMSIARAVKSLEEKGYIRKESGKEDGTENKYFLISPEITSQPPIRKHYVCKNFTQKSNIITKTFIEEINKAKISAKRPETYIQLINKLSTFGKYMPMSYNKAAAAMTIMDSKGLTPNILGTMTITAKDVEMQIANFTGISATFNISTSKLLTAGIIRFTQQNNIGDLRKTESEILIPVKEYAALCGYDVEERPTNTPEEQQKEKNRVKNLLKYVRKEIDKDLELLYNASVSFKTNSSDYTDIRIITKKGIANKGKYIQMKFEEDFAKSLKTCRLTMFPINLFKVKNPTAYRIGIAMSNHYNNDNNLISKTADRMKIKTLLEYSGLPTIEEVRKSRKSWRERIQEPFEKALETLHSEKILDNYEYVRTGNAEISDLDIDLEYYKVDSDYQFTDFETWTGLLVKFKLHEAIDHTERIEQKLNEKESSKSSKKKVSRQKRETNNTETIEPKRKRGRPKKSE